MPSSMDRLRFGTAGVPLSAKGKGSLEGLKRVAELGLDAMELEFVRGVRMGKDLARTLGEFARKHDIVLTAHAPYYINLFNPDPKTYERSVEHILASARVLGAAGGWSVVFHAGYYGKMPLEKMGEHMKETLKRINKALEDEGVDVWIRPETTGKPTQWGTLKEILEVSQEFDNVMPCVDFAHMHARTDGKYNTVEEWRQVFSMIEDYLGREGLESMHIHMSGIAYGPKGEKEHLNLEESDLRWRDLLDVWKEFKIKGVVISESPNIEGDALLLMRAYRGEKR